MAPPSSLSSPSSSCSCRPVRTPAAGLSLCLSACAAGGPTPRSFLPGLDRTCGPRDRLGVCVCAGRPSRRVPGIPGYKGVAAGIMLAAESIPTTRLAGWLAGRLSSHPWHVYGRDGGQPSFSLRSGWAFGGTGGGGIVKLPMRPD